MIDVGIIRIYEGPIHTRLRKIWDELSRRSQPIPWTLNWFDNPDLLSHGEMLQHMWETLRDTPNRYTLLTEHDFLPGPRFPGVYQFDLYSPETAILAAEYCTRNPDSYALDEHGLPGAWYILIDKERLGRYKIDLTAGGRFNDPAAKLPRDITGVLKSYDCMPHHYGVRVGDVGEHLFWSRHYNDVPWKEVAGFPLWDVIGRVRNTIRQYEEDQCIGTSSHPAPSSE